MRLSLATKFSTIIVGVVILALFSSVSALLSTWHIGRVMQRTVDQSLQTVRLTGQLQMLLCEPRGALASYILEDRNRAWLDELQERRRALNVALTDARRLAQTSEEKASLQRLESAYRAYDAKREEVITLCSRGDMEEATRILGKDVNDFFMQAYQESQGYVAATEGYVGSQTVDAGGQVRRATWLVGICAVSTIGLGAVLLGFFFRGVLLPLRRMSAEARSFAGEATVNERQDPKDDLRALGNYLRMLMSNAADTRSTLERSRSELGEAEKKLASVGKLAASVAHEIRNPLNSIRLCLSCVQTKIGKEAGLHDEFEIVSEEFTRLDGILKSFLEFSRPPALKPRPLCMCSLLDKTLALVRHQVEQKRLRVRREDASDLPPVMADPEQLKQVLINLVKNAAEAAPEDSEVVVSAAPEEMGARGMVVLRVQNGGRAIPEDVRQRIFEPFFTTKPEGTGLGLSIAARIMAAHGGRLALESSSDQKTVFALWIPMAQEGKDNA